MSDGFLFRSSKINTDFILKLLLGVLVLVYLINSITPLRLHVDAIRYFLIKDCFEFGCPPDSSAAMDYLPYGYTLLLIGLSKLKILSSFTLVIINCGYLFMSLFFIKYIFKSVLKFEFFLIIVLLNWAIIKFVTHPLSEMQYMFFSMASLFFFKKFEENKKIYSVLLSFFFAAIALLTRTVGIALIVALFVGLLWPYRESVLPLLKRYKVITATSIIIIVFSLTTFISQLGIDHYVTALIKEFSEGVGYKDILRWHFIELTEIFLNSSIVKVKDILPYSSLVSFSFLIIGITLVLFIVRLIFTKRKEVPLTITVYLTLYSLIIFNWPYYDPRFWVPILPILLILLYMNWHAELQKDKFKSRFVIYSLYLTYLLFGVVSVGYFTYTSFNNEIFIETQASGVYRKEYKEVLFNSPNSLHNGDTTIVKLLKQYN